MRREEKRLSEELKEHLLQMKNIHQTQAGPHNPLVLDQVLESMRSSLSNLGPDQAHVNKPKED